MIHTRVVSVLALAAALCAGLPVNAESLGPSSGFLPTYSGPQGGDLDITSASATLTGGDFQLDASFAAPLGTTAPDMAGDAPVYVWGIYRGTTGPQELSFAPQYPGVVFDAVVLAVPSSSFAEVVDFFPNPASPGMTTTGIVMTASGNMLDLQVPESDLPVVASLNQSQFEVNLWPRYGITGGVEQIAQFDPADAVASLVPEPGSWVMLLAGFLWLGISLRWSRQSALTN